MIPDVVHQELLNGERDHPHLRSVLDATSDWIEVRSISRPTEMVVLARYASALVGADGRKNLGESGVLALAEVIPGVAILREAATDADVVVFSPPFEQIARAAELVGPLADKILVDTTNPFNPERTGLVDLAGSSSLAIVARHFPGSRLVKALHSLGVDQARAAREAVGPVVALMAGDDREAMSTVAQLVLDAGLIPVSTGGLDTVKLSEAPGPRFMQVYDVTATAP